MLFKLFTSQKGYTVVEVLTVVIILSILTAVAVPLFHSGYESEGKKDCKSQCVVIEALVKEAMTGMLDSGSKQYKRNADGTLVVPKVAAIDFSRVQSDHKTKYVADDIQDNADDVYNGQECFVLIKDQAIPGKIAFTMSDLRGGYRPNPKQDYRVGCEQGYYLKKKKLETVPFYTYLANSEIPICPFADSTKPDKDYHYYIFADGTVLCSCPDCHEN